MKNWVENYSVKSVQIQSFFRSVFGHFSRSEWLNDNAQKLGFCLTDLFSKYKMQSSVGALSNKYC